MDAFVIRSVVVGNAVVCCLCIMGIVLVAATGHEPPSTLVALASLAFGLLAGIPISPRNGGGNGNGGAGSANAVPAQGQAQPVAIGNAAKRD